MNLLSPGEVPFLEESLSWSLTRPSMVELTFHPRIEPLLADEPADFLYEYTGDVVLVDDYDREMVVGRHRAYYVDLEAAYSAGFTSRHEIFDTEGATEEYYSALFEPGVPGFRIEVERLFGCEIVDLNVLILDRLELLPEVRGRGLGLAIMRRRIERFGAGCGIVGIKPFPLQCEPRDLDSPDRGWRAKLGLTAFASEIETGLGGLHLTGVDLPGELPA
ncbi:MAG: hypothetical protein ACLF0P_11420, partial [Thermoanaerobaculia bacterium]